MKNTSETDDDLLRNSCSLPDDKLFRQVNVQKHYFLQYKCSFLKNRIVIHSKKSILIKNYFTYFKKRNCLF